MRTKIFYIVAVVLIFGLSIGAWRMQHNHNVVGGAVAGQPKTTILFVSTKGKSDWILGQCFRFNLANSTYNVVLHYVESRDAMQKILSSQIQPVIWSTDNPAIVGRLNDLWTQRHGQPLVNTTGAGSTRVYFHSPLVFLTTKEKLARVEPILSSPNCWDTLSQMGQGTNPPTIRFAISNPETASGGLLTIGLILDTYCSAHHLSPDDISVAQSKGFTDYLVGIERCCSQDSHSLPDSVDLMTEYISNPKLADFIVVQESQAIQAAKDDKNLYVIYPNPTVNVSEGISLVSGPWVTDDQKAGAALVLAYLGTENSIHDGVQKFLRPDEQETQESLDPALASFSSQGFRPNYVETTAPNYKAINEAIYTWKTHRPQE